MNIREDMVQMMAAPRFLNPKGVSLRILFTCLLVRNA